MMNIKRMPSCIAVVVAALLLAVSCGNMLEAPKAEGVEGGMGRLSVSMGDGRAVFPEELKFEADKELTFTLSGSLDGGEDKEIRSWSASETQTAYQVMAADTSLTVEAGQWSFTLQAKRGGTVVATASKDLEVKGGQENRLSFGTMAYSNEGTGTVTVTISWNEGEEVTSVVAGLYHRDSGELVSGTEVTFGTIEGAQVTYTKSDIPAGIYRLKAQMYQDDAVIGTYSELVRVAGGLSSEAERELGSLNTLYTVTFNANGGTGTMDSQTFISGVEQELSANAFERENYTFSGWSEDKAADAATYTDKAMFTATKDTSLYAVWEANVTIAIEGSTATITIPDDAKDTRVQHAMNEFTADGLTTIIVEGPLNETRQGYIATALAGKTVTLYLTHLAKEELTEAFASTADGITVNCGCYMADASTYVAYNADGLQAWSTNVQTNPATNLSLAKDITLPLAEGETSNWTSVGTETTPYMGTVNGNGYSITGMTINQTTNYAGFIGYLGKSGVVKNLKLKDVSVTTTGKYVGGLVGYSFSVIENCAVEGGTISASASEGLVGGIVGYAEGTNSVPALIVACHNTAAVSGKYRVGGIIGYSEPHSRVIACYNSGPITDTELWGCSGIAGRFHPAVTYLCCNYNTGTTPGKAAIAGLAADYEYHNYWSSNHEYAYGGTSSDDYKNLSATKITSASEWQTAMTTMNTWLAENDYAYRYVLNTDAATKEAQPLVIVEAPATE